MIQVSCPNCDKEYNLKDELAGRTFKCKNCDAKVKIPDDEEADEPVNYFHADVVDEDDDNDEPVVRKKKKSKSRGDDFTRKELAQVASAQRAVLWLLLGNFATYALLCVHPYFLLLIPVIIITGCIFIFKLALRVRSSVPIIYPFMLFIPLFALIAMLYLNNKATKIIQDHGYHVGLMGATDI